MTTRDQDVERRPCCASCAHWTDRPHVYNRCDQPNLECDHEESFRPHAHFLCVLYEPRYPKLDPARPELFDRAAGDGKNDQYHQELAESFKREVLRKGEWCRKSGTIA